MALLGNSIEIKIGKMPQLPTQIVKNTQYYDLLNAFVVDKFFQSSFETQRAARVVGNGKI